MKKILSKVNLYLKKHHDYIVLSIIFLIASFFRLYKLDSIPFGLNNDAAWEGSAAINILHGNIKDYLPYATESWRGEGIIRIIVAFFMQVLGNDPITIRLASVIFGIGLIIPLFLLIKDLFGTKLAALTTFFVAISGWHITISKSGWRAITVPFFATLLFYFYFKGLKTKKLIYFAISGIMLSIGSLYTYDAGRIILPLFIFWVIFSAYTKKGFFSKYKRALTLLFASFLVVSIPMLNYALENRQNFISRSDFLFIGNQIQQAGNLSPLINNIITSVLTFNIKANGNDFFIFRPLVDIPVSLLIPIGFLFCVWKILAKKSINFLFIMFWFLFSMIPGILSAPNGNREIGTIPVIYFFAALGLNFIVDLIEKVTHLKKNFKTLLVVGFLFLSTFVTYYLYLGPKRLELPGFYPETLIVTNYIKTIWNNYDIYLTDNFPRELLTYYLYKNSRQDAFARNYTWLDNSLGFLNIKSSSQTDIIPGQQYYYSAASDTLTQTNNKGLAFFMFTNLYNEQTAQQLLSMYPQAKKLYLNYINDNINRPAILVVLIPPLR